MDQYHAIHAGDRVVITHGEAAKLHRGKVWVVATGPEPCPCCGKLAVTLKGYDGIIGVDNIARVRDDDYPARYQ